MVRKGLCLAMLALMIALVACAPKQAPAPSAPAPLPTTSIPRLPTAPSLSPEDVAWAQVVEAAKKEGKVIVYTFQFAGDTGVQTAKAFKDKYGITVEFITGRSPTIVERIRTEYRANQLVADLAEGAGARLMLLKDWGFTDSLRDLPVLKDKDVWKGDIKFYDPEAHLLIYTPSPMTVIINTQLVKPADEPRSWYDLLEPRWKGKIITQDPVQGLENYILYVNMTRAKMLPHDYFENLARQDLRFTMGGPADTIRALAQGEGYMTAPGSAVGAIPVLQAGGPIKLLTMKEGFPVSTLPFAFLKNSPHPNAAKVFMNWLLSAEGMRLYAETALTYSFRKDVPDAAPPNAIVDWSKALYGTFDDQREVDKIWNEQLMVKILKKRS